MRKRYIFSSLLVLFAMLVTAQITQVTDVNTTNDSGIGTPALYNGEIFFAADAGGEVSKELYKLSAGGVVSLVKDINVDPDDSSPSSMADKFIEFNGKLYFKANDGDYTGHDNELWVTDGTTEGTMLVMDIDPRLKKGSNPQQMFVFNDTLYFMCNDGTSTQWWKNNGMDTLVKVSHLNGDGFATPYNAIVDEANNFVYFQANNGKNELHVMRADESIEIIDINAGTGHGYVGSQAILFNGKLYFQGDNGTDGDELFVSDGTVAGTSMIKDINTTALGDDSNPESFTLFNDKLYFVADPGTGTQLWVTDGTADGTMMVAAPVAAGEGEVDNLVVYKDKLYFSATDGTNGVELWVFDGTTASMLKDIKADGDSDPEGFIEVGGLLFFEATTGENSTLWVTDGTADNTVSVASLFEETEDPLDINLGESVVIGTKLFFTGDDEYGDDMFMIDAATVSFDEIIAASSEINQVTNINTADDSSIGALAVYNGEIFFAADAGDAVSKELYKLSAGGVVSLVKDINVDPDDSSPSSMPDKFIEFNGKLYFKANDGDYTGHDNELWVTDGTNEGTKLVMDIDPRLKKGSNPQQMFVFNDTLYFMCNDGTSTQWWKNNGMDTLVKVSHLKDDGFATPYSAIVDEANNFVYFQANNGKNELHVMRADESIEIIDINAGTGHGYVGSQAILFNGKLYFQGDNGTDGDELFVSDGTVAGTSMIKDINTTALGDDSNPESFTLFNDKLYFVADPGTGTQLWVTDGTADGTMMVAAPVAAGEGEVDNLHVYKGNLYFSATDGTNGIELWVFDGTTARMLKDIKADGDSDPEGFMEVGGLLFFEATAGENSTLWVTDGTADNTVSVASVLGSSIDPTDINLGESAVIGTKLYFTGDDENGDDIFMVDAADIKFDGPDAINETSFKTMKVYPNPSNGLIQINNVQSGAYTLYDIQGRNLEAGQFTGGSLSLDVPNGIYFLNVRSVEGSFMEKLMIK